MSLPPVETVEEHSVTSGSVSEKSTVQDKEVKHDQGAPINVSKELRVSMRQAIDEGCVDQLQGKDGKAGGDQNMKNSTHQNLKKSKLIDEIAGMSIQECIEKIKGNLETLGKIANFECVETMEEIRFFKCLVLLASKQRSKTLAGLKELAHNDFVKIFQKIFKENIYCQFDKEGSQHLFNNMYALLVTMWNGTDASKVLCETVVNEKLYQDLFMYLDHDRFLPEELDGSAKRTAICKGCLGILHNVIQKCDVRVLYRDCDAVRILEKIGRSKQDMVKSKALMVLAHVINEDENEKLYSDDKVIKFLMKILTNTLQSDAHFSKKYGYRASEILDVLIMLAANDKNKERIVKYDGIKYLTELMGKSASQAEHAKAARTIWTLAFAVKDEILKDNECIQALKNLEENDDLEVKKQATGALWVLHGKNLHSDVSHLGGGEEQPHITPTADHQHIMISYQWSNQAVMLQVRDRLQAAGYRVWMDVDEMRGSILEAMAKAIENASVVLVCMSQKYKESPNCRTEGDYAFAKHKPIIPLKLEYRYSPDGWLGALVGSLLYFDFSVQQKFEASFNGLLKELGDKMKMVKAITPIKVDEVDGTTTLPPCAPVVSKPVYSTWDTEQVQSWLTANQLNGLTQSFAQIDGSLLHEYKLMMRDAPEFFFKSLEASMKLDLVDSLKLTRALRQL